MGCSAVRCEEEAAVTCPTLPSGPLPKWNPTGLECTCSGVWDRWGSRDCNQGVLLQEFNRLGTSDWASARTSLKLLVKRHPLPEALQHLILRQLLSRRLHEERSRLDRQHQAEETAMRVVAARDHNDARDDFEAIEILGEQIRGWWGSSQFEVTHSECCRPS